MHVRRTDAMICVHCERETDYCVVCQSTDCTEEVPMCVRCGEERGMC